MRLERGHLCLHAEASEGVKRLSFDKTEADIGRSGDVRQAEMPALQSHPPSAKYTSKRNSV
ncbi:MAG: hypothetical protein DMF63_16520 [Acidobacteria bacterium]|nr:MAG: hypothetical protein DMF63_16520 [Acidobacteriota bacterium]